MNKKHFLKKALFKNNHLVFVLSVVVLAVAYALDVAFAWLMQELFDSVGNRGHFGLLELVIIFAVLFSVAVIAQLAFRTAHSRFVKKAMFQYKKTAVEKLIEHKLNDYKIANSSTFLSAMSNDLSTIENRYLLGMFTISIQAVQLVLALGMMLWYNWALTLIAIVASAIAFGVSMLFGNKASATEKLVSEKMISTLGQLRKLLKDFRLSKRLKRKSR